MAHLRRQTAGESDSPVPAKGSSPWAQSLRCLLLSWDVSKHRNACAPDSARRSGRATCTWHAGVN
eukprot:11077385-Alexandrium_andersonii.AAC.1